MEPWRSGDQSAFRDLSLSITAGLLADLAIAARHCSCRVRMRLCSYGLHINLATIPYAHACRRRYYRAWRDIAHRNGIYFRLMWRGWLSDADLKRYASKVYQLHEITPEAALCPEWVLQQVDHAGSYAAGSERLWPQIYVISNT